MRLTLQNFKGHTDATFDLPRLTLLSGPCGAGKSSVADGLTWLLLGHLPRLGRRLADSAELMRGRAMAATLELDDGRTVTRELSYGKKGALTQSVTCAWLPEGARSEEHEAACLALVGGDELAAAEGLDIRSLLNATGPRRTQRIQQLLAAGGMSPDERVALVCEYTARRLTHKEGDEIADWRDLVPLIPGTSKDGAHRGVRAVLSQSQSSLKSYLTGEGLGAAKAWAGGEKNRAAGEAKKALAAREELTTRLGELAEIDEELLADDEARLRQLDEAVGAARQVAAEAAAKLVRRDQLSAKIVGLEGRLKGYLEALATAEATAADHQQAEAALAAAQAALAAIPELVPPEYDTAAEDATREKIADLEASIVPVGLPERSPVTLAEAALERAKEALTRAEADPWCTVVAKSRWLSDAISKLVKKGAAQTQMMAACAELAALAESQGYVDEQALKDAVEAAEATLADAIGRFNAASLDAETKSAANLVTRGMISGLRASIEAARVAFVDVKREAAEAWESTHGEAKREADAQIVAAKRILAAPAPNVDAIKAQIQATEEALTAAQVERAELGDVAEATAIDTTERDALAADIRQRRDTASRRSELVRVTDALAQADAEREVFAAIEWACTQALAREAQDASRALLEPMREFLRAAGRTEDPFCEAAAIDFRIGWRTSSGEEVSVKTLCGGEWPVFVSALAAAVHSLSAAPLRVVLVEAGETDERHLAQILAGFRASEGIRAIVATQRDVTTEPTGWSLVRLGGDAAGRMAA